MALSRYSVNRTAVNAGRLLGAVHDLAAGLAVTQAITATITAGITLSSAMATPVVVVAGLGPNSHDMASNIQAQVEIDANLQAGIHLVAEIATACSGSAELLVAITFQSAITTGGAIAADMDSSIDLASNIPVSALIRSRCKFDPEEFSYDCISVMKRVASISTWTAQ